MGDIKLVQRMKALAALATAVSLLLLVICGTWASGAGAASKLSFDPTLSLTGGCTEPSTIDPVPDPSCPGGPLPPSGSFEAPTSVATDSYGNIYVASFGLASDGSEGRIDIFDSSGFFITEIIDPDGPRSLAVDSAGTLYVVNGIDANTPGRRIVRYVPTVYDPASGEIAYGNPPAVVRAKSPAPIIDIAVDAANDHLIENGTIEIVRYGSATEGNPKLESFGAETLSTHHPTTGMGLAVDAARRLVYVNAVNPEKDKFGEIHYHPVIEVFDLDPPHELLAEIDGSTTPAGKFSNSLVSLGVDEDNGHLFVYDWEVSKLYELTESGGYVGTLEHGFQPFYGPQIGVDNGEHSPHGALSLQGRYVYVPSHPTGVGHSFAFGPIGAPCEPSVSSPSFTEVNETEAELGATVDPCNAPTNYVFEYTTLTQFNKEGFAGAQVAGSGQMPAAGVASKVSTTAEDLSPDTSYRFRVVVTNEEGSAEAEGSFSTYPAFGLGPCPNDSVRTGFSALLPDCRAYELVTPPDTNSRTPLGLSKIGSFFTTQEASPAGDKVSFRLEGGTIPGIGGTGSVNGDPYLATRGSAGWSTSYAGPPALEAPVILTGSHSPDQGYSFWDNAGGGSSAVNGEPTNYVRYPDGHSALVGRGSLGIHPQAVGNLISEGGGHIIFTSGPNSTAVQLEPNAAPDGTWAIYDRTSDEVTHVVSLLPGDVTPQAGEDAGFVGASLDGRGVAFSIGSKLYLRYDNSETYEIGEDVTFAGVAEGGSRIFYVKGGNLFRFDAQTEAVTPFGGSGNVTPVNVSSDGSAAYFVSSTVLTEAPNPRGDEAVPGEENLYLSREGSISFVGTVTERDVDGEKLGGEMIDGLGLWTAAIGPTFAPPGRLAADPSRTTPDGSVLLFQSRANLTDYASQSSTQIYRYDSAGGVLECLSCNPTGAAPAGDATLQSMKQREDKEARSAYSLVNNLRADGRRAFFQSRDALVARDTDQLQDVYEWEDQGVGTCARPGGCVYLISSGHSRRDDHLHAVSESGDDVFFVSSDLLLGVDSDETASIYDARVGGGFPESAAAECEGEGCRGALPPPTVLPTPNTPPLGKEGKPAKPCPKGKRRVKRNGKVRCVKRHQKRHRRPGVRKEAGR